MKKNYFYGTILGLTLLVVACKKSNETPVAKLVKEITLNLSTGNENPQPAGRTETGTATIKIFDDNSLTVDATVAGLSASDNLTLSHIHTGDPVTNGPVVLDLKPTFTGNTMKAVVTGVRSTLLDSMKADNENLYLNIHSTQAGGGIVRGQFANPVTYALSVSLSGANEVPAVTTTATGVALLKITADNRLFSKITVTNLETTDVLAAGHIHSGAAGVNGPVILGLCGSAADFNVTKIFTPSATLIASIKNDALYVNAHSATRPGGVVRGQIR